MEENKSGKTNFKGWDLSNRPYELTSFECKECPNHCEIRKVTVQGEKPLFYGSRCEKYDVDRTRKRRDDLPDLFAEREEALMASYVEEKPVPEDAPTIGIPRLLHFHELMPFWRTFFTALGFRVVYLREDQQASHPQGSGEDRGGDLFPHQGGPRPSPRPDRQRGGYHLPAQRHQHAPQPSLPGPLLCLPLRPVLSRTP